MTPAIEIASPTAASQCPGVNAVVLSGGGANGAYEVGVLKALLGGASPATSMQPLRPGIVTGTSIGGFNAAALVSRYHHDNWLDSAQDLENIWLDLIPRDDSTSHNHIYRFRANPFEFLNPGLLMTNPMLPVQDFAKDAVHFVQAFFASAAAVLEPNGKIEARVATAIDFSALISNEPSVRLVHQVMAPLVIRESDIKLRIISTNWDTGVVRIFENWDMTDQLTDSIVLSSTAMPGVFPGVVMDGDTYVDGGVVMNTPLLPALQAGADTLHLIYLDPSVGSIPVSSLHSTLDTLARMITVMFATKMNDDIRRAALVNRWAKYVENATAANNVSTDQEDVFKQILGVTTLRPVVIHRYHPLDDIGGGLLGWLDFSRERIASLIDRGFSDAVNHDCFRSGCVLSDGTVLSTALRSQFTTGSTANAPGT